MSSATDTTVTVSFDPNATSKQSDIIGPATTSSAGVMTAAQAAKVATTSVTSFVYTVQIGDGSDFIVPIPLAKRPATTSYVPTVTVGVVNFFTGVTVDFATLATAQFRVTTDAPLPVGTPLGITITEIS